MPKRTDIKSILIIGAGPIVIGQACEFDYSGAQACKALRAEGYRVILVNSNPATIMTDPEMADAVYIEPINQATLASVIAKEKPDALLPTMGGQTALNCALELSDSGLLEEMGVMLIGASPEAIRTAEDRLLFRDAMTEIGLASPRKAHLATTLEEARAAQEELGFPTVIRPGFTLGGSGGGIAYDQEQFERIVARGLELSPVTQVLVEESLLGWKEFETEVVRDTQDNCIIVCTIENLDPMGVHTGDSITVAPAQTLTDKEYQRLRDASLKILRRIGVETGGANVQFAINPEDGRLVVIEMNPRVSRSSALASKATGFPIAKVAAKLAVGYTLDELSNDITGGVIPAPFEPTLDYVVTKIPRFAFEKFAAADARLTTQMQSVGEVMALGSSFQESVQKALRGLETGLCGFDPTGNAASGIDGIAKIEDELKRPGPERIRYVAEAFRAGFSLERVHELSTIDPWFLDQIYEIVELEAEVKAMRIAELDRSSLRLLKRKGFSDARLACLLDVEEHVLRDLRIGFNLRPVYKRVDSCAAEFPATTPYMYSTYAEECESNPSARQKVMILGGGPNRIGQGLEFDYCCVHAAMALREDGYEAIMVNCNPETVSTDYDTSDRLYFEPLTLEDVLEIVHLEKPMGVIVQFGGQTPLKLAQQLEALGVPILGTRPDSIDLAEDRERFRLLMDEVGLLQPPNRIARTVEEARAMSREIGFPLVVRPSYVLGGRAMEIVHNEEGLLRYVRVAVDVSETAPILLDRYVQGAIEVDVDAVVDATGEVYIGGIMEHVEEAGVHSGDSSCCLPPHSLTQADQERLSEQVRILARKLGVVGLTNAQFAITGDDIFVLEVNPRASRTVPFVSKATAVPLAKVAARCMVGMTLAAQGVRERPAQGYYAVKEAVFPFAKFDDVDPVLGPEMRSTGEAMGFGFSFSEAFARAEEGAGVVLPTPGVAFLSVRDADKNALLPIARKLEQLGFELLATDGTMRHLSSNDIASTRVNKVTEGTPHVVDMIRAGRIVYIVNTTEGPQSLVDSFTIRRTAVERRVSYSTTMPGALAMVNALDWTGTAVVRSLQDLHSKSYQPARLL